MKRKVGALIEDKVMRRAKRRAVEEGRSLSQVIQNALLRYLDESESHPEDREKAYAAFCSHPLKLTPGEFRQVLEDDQWNR
ncbi:MAG: hypothetical protein HY914_07015 [Desulfomonile tiedjei]|nr:hypothetical protein [Desulfomonile tiedjei]